MSHSLYLYVHEQGIHSWYLDWIYYCCISTWIWVDYKRVMQGMANLSEALEDIRNRLVMQDIGMIEIKNWDSRWWNGATYARIDMQICVGYTGYGR